MTLAAADVSIVSDLGPGCDLWWLRLAGVVSDRCLSADEQARSAAFISAPARSRYLAARVALRTLCGAYTGVPPEQIRFTYEANGKPSLVGKAVHFNVAHCEQMAVFAFARGADVGIDVERVRPLPDMDETARAFLSSNQLELYQRLNETERQVLFFREWTRREAWAKLTGEGLAAVLESGAEARCWFGGFVPLPGYLVTLAMERAPEKVAVREFWFECLRPAP